MDKYSSTFQNGQRLTVKPAHRHSPVCGRNGKEPTAQLQAERYRYYILCRAIKRYRNLSNVPEALSQMFDAAVDSYMRHRIAFEIETAN